MPTQAFATLAGIVLYTVLLASPMWPQASTDDCKPLKPPTADKFPAFVIRQLPTDTTRLRVDSVALLEKYLSCGQWQRAIKTYLRNYQEKLPAWIVYIDEKDHVHQALLARGKLTRTLTGERHVWLILFSRNRRMTGDRSYV